MIFGYNHIHPEVTSLNSHENRRSWERQQDRSTVPGHFIRAKLSKLKASGVLLHPSSSNNASLAKLEEKPGNLVKSRCGEHLLLASSSSFKKQMVTDMRWSSITNG